MGPIGWIAFVLVVIGGLNWGLVGIFNWNLVAAIFGDMTVVARIVYILVGLSALYMIIKSFGGSKAPVAAPTV